MSMPTALECVSLFLLMIGMFAGIIALIFKAEDEQEQRRREYRYGWK